MKVLFSDRVAYAGRDGNRYLFLDKIYGDVISTISAKLVDREEDVVIMFLQSYGSEPDVQYSYSTLRKHRIPENAKVDLSKYDSRIYDVMSRRVMD